MARRRRGLPIDGVLLLDKPKGMSSNFALQRARRLYQAAFSAWVVAFQP